MEPRRVWVGRYFFGWSRGDVPYWSVERYTSRKGGEMIAFSFGRSVVALGWLSR